MSEKTIILMSRPIYGIRPTQLNLGTWSEAEQKKFLERIRGFKRLSGDNFHCGFDVFYDAKTALEVRPDAKIIVTDWNPDSCRLNNDNEIVISMYPYIRCEHCIVHPYMQYSNCVAASLPDCPICMQNGGCTAPAVRNMLGEVLFPEKYLKHK